MSGMTREKYPHLVHEGVELTYTSGETAPFVQGRREFFHYRDLGVAEGSDRRLRGTVTKAVKNMPRPTGWHYHQCDVQFLYCLSGWVDLEFEDGRKIRFGAGDSLYIPGGMRHNEITFSNDFECLEVTVPADMGTVACEAPQPS